MMKTPGLWHLGIGDPQCQKWGWQCIKLDVVSVVSIDVGAAVGAAPTLCLYNFGLDLPAPDTVLPKLKMEVC